MADSSFWLFLIEMVALGMLWFFIVEFNDGFGKEEDLERLAGSQIFPPHHS